MRTVIKNAIVVTMNEKREIHNPGFVMFLDDCITHIGNMKNLPQEAESADIIQVEAKGAILMPGMVNLHTHMGMIPFRGLGDDCKDRLRTFLFPMEQKAMDEELVYHSTRYAAAEMLLSGVTTVYDMYYYEEEAAKAMDEMGIRGIAAQTIITDGACDFKDPFKAMEYGERLIRKYKSHTRISGAIAPHGTSTCEEEALKVAYGINTSLGSVFSLHAAEMDYEMDYFRRTKDKTPIGYLNRIGVLGENTLAAHCIHMTREDLLLLKDRGAKVAHCIGSNTKAAKGVAPVREMRELNLSVGLGTDGPSSGNTLDLFTQMKLFADFHKNETRDRSVFPAEQIVACATIEGARALLLSQITGSLELGKQADLVLIETQSMNMFPIYDPYSTLVYSASPFNVEEVYVAGVCLVKNKKLILSDQEKIKEELRRKMVRTAFKDYMKITE